MKRLEERVRGGVIRWFEIACGETRARRKLGLPPPEEGETPKRPVKVRRVGMAVVMAAFMLGGTFGFVVGASLRPLAGTIRELQQEQIGKLVAEEGGKKTEEGGGQHGLAIPERRTGRAISLPEGGEQTPGRGSERRSE